MLNLNLLRSAQAVAFLLGVTLMNGSQALAVVLTNVDGVIRNSLCVGFDCPNAPAFGSDTIILQENNTRILFLDTSNSPFPTNDWRLVANDSVNGGGNLFAIEDATANRRPFTVEAGARANALYVESDGDIGIGTNNPVVNLHIVDGNTPTVRLDQDGSSGFTPQTWDLAGNETNFFLRDVTNGSRLPFRIRPGAPTSSIDIAANGNVGIGTASPTTALTAKNAGATLAGVANVVAELDVNSAPAAGVGPGLIFSSNAFRHAAISGLSKSGSAVGELAFYTRQSAGGILVERVRINFNGNVGIGTADPAAQIHTTGTVRFAGVANCASGIQSNANGDLSCLVSSRQFKDIAGSLKPSVALANVMALRPQTGAYKTTPDQPEHWLIAEDVANVDPALAGFADGKPYTVKTQNVVADLVAVIQQQQQRIDALEKSLAR